MGRKGFTLVEIMIVVAIIALLAAIAIPNLLRARLNANEAAAQSTLKSISTAIESFRAGQTTPSYPANDSGDGVLTDVSDATPPYLDGGIFAAAGRQGYIFNYYTLGVNQYVACGQPITLNVTGNRTFAINETGVLRATDGKTDITTTALYDAMTAVQ